MWPKGFIMPPVETALPATRRHRQRGLQLRDDADDSTRSGCVAGRERCSSAICRTTTCRCCSACLGLALLIVYYYFIWEGRPRSAGTHHHSRIRMPAEPVAGLDALSDAHGLRQRVFRRCGAEPRGEGSSAHPAEPPASWASARRSRWCSKTSPGAKPLTADEQKLLAELFADGDTLVLEQENHGRVSEARTEHQPRSKRGYTSGFFNINGGWHFLGIVLSLLLCARRCCCRARRTTGRSGISRTPRAGSRCHGAGALVANGVFGKLLKAPTVAGQTAMDHIRGFKMYLEVAEGEELKRMNAPPPSSRRSSTSPIYRRRWRWAWSSAGPRRSRACSRATPNYPPAWYAGPAWNIREHRGLFVASWAHRCAARSLRRRRRRVRARAAEAAARRVAAVVAAAAAAGRRGWRQVGSG